MTIQEQNNQDMTICMSIVGQVVTEYHTTLNELTKVVQPIK